MVRLKPFQALKIAENRVASIKQNANAGVYRKGTTLSLDHTFLISLSLVEYFIYEISPLKKPLSLRKIAKEHKVSHMVVVRLWKNFLLKLKSKLIIDLSTVETCFKEILVEKEFKRMLPHCGRKKILEHHSSLLRGMLEKDPYLRLRELQQQLLDQFGVDCAISTIWSTITTDLNFSWKQVAYYHKNRFSEANMNWRLLITDAIFSFHEQGRQIFFTVKEMKKKIKN
jgi:hypothetical protein